MEPILTIRLRLENDDVPEDWLVRTDLQDVLALASAANRAAKDPEIFDLSFTTMLYGFLLGSDSCCRFFQTYAEQGLNRSALLARKDLTEVALARLAVDSAAGIQLPLVYTVSAKNLLTNARDLRPIVPNLPDQSGPIDVRHLMAAYIYQPAGHSADLESIGISRVRWSNAFRGWIGGVYPEESAHWDRIHKDTFRSVADTSNAPPSGGGEPVLSSRSNRVVFDNDLVLEKISLDKDRLGMAPEVRRLAGLLAARDIHPPIALGLFGRWGSGKSFFMGMLRQRVEDLAQVDTSGTYAANAVQITFNAWHYQDASLWASLALRIFEGIAENIAGKDPTEAAKKRQELHTKLGSSVKLRREAEDRRDTATKRRASAAADLEHAQQQRTEADSKLSAARLQRVWKKLTEGPAFGKQLTALKSDVAALGLNDAVKGIDDISRMQSQLQALDGDVRSLVRALGASFRDRRSSIISCASVGAVIAAVVLLHRWVPATAQVYQLLTVAGAGLAWSTRKLNQLSSAARNADVLRQSVASAWADSSPSEDEAKLVREVQTLDAAIQQANAEIAAAEQRAAEAEAEIQRINAGGLVYDFLTERRASNAYLAHIGLISTIRQDFEKLRELLDDLKTHGTRPIDRIILYIDDLDRCDPDKVVEVLQAVHLLLAFNIFNVVVGVDARWLERALNEMYGRTMTQVQRAAQSVQVSSPFRAQNYLEKIFQISYSLGAMNQDTFGQLVADLIPTRSEIDAGSKMKQEERKQEERKQVEQKQEERGERKAEAGDRKKSAARDEDVIDIKETVGTLFFEDFEEEFLKELYAFIDTPRLAKRLVNIYRLLRIRASEEGFEEFLSSSSTGTYRAALVLLAINIGYPSVGRKLLVELSSPSSETSIQGLVKTLKSPDSEESEQQAFETVRNRFGEMADIPSGLAPYMHWAPRVGRYSFDWHLAPGTAEAQQAQNVSV
jgi:hypothetical protein